MKTLFIILFPFFLFAEDSTLVHQEYTLIAEARIADESTPIRKESTSITEESTLNPEKSIQNSEESDRNSEESTQNSEKSTQNSEKSTQNSKESTENSKESTQNADKSILIPRESTIVPKESTPIPDESTLIPEQSPPSKLYYMASSVLYGITAGIGEAYRIEYEHGGKVDASKQELNAKWHNWKLASAPFIVGTGYTVALNSGLNIPKAARGLLTSAVLAWISHDIAYNATRQLYVFRKADSPAITEMNFSIKLIALGGVLLMEYFFD